MFVFSFRELDGTSLGTTGIESDGSAVADGGGVLVSVGADVVVSGVVVKLKDWLGKGVSCDGTGVFE
jgi:hypothetical protein